ncbi:MULTISPECIES: NUDIX domain-containing protein [unclassified Rhizobium]|uniref:NUDIX domain-containing protein n=1 Tax=unclassified Rhizobium TaxID=2613769 RepID=UPI0007128CF6|nr:MULTISPECIES: NUDIX domain-containing protein [unclassified Rhizobium]KQS99152.1 DNA mismatch repair protein MutT [Rhizobium sp. Leaf386]KQT05373.1 DNA mismatch repair protein MutT [Rhizobium sp. Leaf391]KQT91815.1 DNA mismatch repair protein MutT [Rhizobium sp. Leaf453]
MTETPPEMRNWRARLVTRLIHGYFAFARGMTMGVRAACFDERGRVFLVRHSYVPGWHMPGGGLERGETAFAALVKELHEEGNLEMTEKPELFHVYFNRLTSKRDHVLFYRCRNVRQVTPKKPDFEIVETGFFALDALPPETTPATHRRLAELAGETPPADVW